MDWNAAIEKNRDALKRVLASLVAMAALPVLRACGDPAGATLPRHLHRAVLRLLRPAESAARRLVILAARGLVVTLPPSRPRKAKPKSTILRNGVGTGILMPAGVSGPLTPPHKGEGGVRVAQGSATDSPSANATESPSPLWGGVRGGGKIPSTRPFGFQLFDPLRRFRPVRPTPSSVPRISLPGYSNPFPVAQRRAPSPDDPVDATRLSLRLAALGRALDDLPGMARRFARWRARGADATSAQNREARDQRRVRRISPLRGGRPPGQRSAKNGRRPVHEVHDILNVVHGLAFWALERPDTS